MIKIHPITPLDLERLSVLSKSTFVSSHGKSASKKDIDIYIHYTYSVKLLRKELNDINNFFYFLHYQNEIVGYSKISINTEYPSIMEKPLAKLDRIYIDEKYLDKKLGQMLFNFNLEIVKQHNQRGIWLYTWIKNDRAIRFYEKNGMGIIDERDFKISKSHSNPNYIMYKSL